LLLLAWINLTAAALAFVAVASYVMVYTLWLKRNTALSAVLSSGIGALPPLIGWIAVSGHLALTPFLLFGIIALWTPPHFWALALSRGDEYKRASLPALPGNRPGLWLVVFIMSLIGATAVLIPVARIGPVYTMAASALGLGYLALSLRPDIERSTRAARRLYVYSIFYLIVLFAAMIISPLV
jgi:protoheme IX farnesyltransferase